MSLSYLLECLTEKVHVGMLHGIQTSPPPAQSAKRYLPILMLYIILRCYILYPIFSNCMLEQEFRLRC